MSPSIGIIGGAEGPTAIFVAGNPLPSILALAVLAGTVILSVWFFRNKK